MHSASTPKRRCRQRHVDALARGHAVRPSATRFSPPGAKPLHMRPCGRCWDSGKWLVTHRLCNHPVLFILPDWRRYNHMDAEQHLRRRSGYGRRYGRPRQQLGFVRRRAQRAACARAPRPGSRPRASRIRCRAVCSAPRRGPAPPRHRPKSRAIRPHSCSSARDSSRHLADRPAQRLSDAPCGPASSECPRPWTGSTLAPRHVQRGRAPRCAPPWLYSSSMNLLPGAQLRAGVDAVAREQAPRSARRPAAAWPPTELGRFSSPRCAASATQLSV